MKRWHLIGILILGMAFAACGFRNGRSVATQNLESPQPTADSALSAIDSLMWQRPDSALMCVISYFDTCCATDYDRHYAHLLLSELLYKNYYAQTNRADLLQAVAYFDSLLVVTDERSVSADNATLAFLAARTHYINGVGYYEQDSAVEACKEYLKALDVMENHFKEKDLVRKKAQFMALTYNRLGDLFSAQFMMEPAITSYEQSLVYCKIGPTSPFGVSNTLFHLGKQYDKLGQREQASEYYQQALEELPILKGSKYRDIVVGKALCDYQLGEGMEQFLDVMRQVIAQTEDVDETFTRYLTIGSVFFEEGLHDSALFYLEPVFKNNDKNIILQLQAADRLRIIYDSLGKEDKANACMRFLAIHKKSEGENKALVSQLESLFQDYLNQKQEQKAAQEKREAVIRTLKILIPIALVLAAVIFWAVRKRGKKRLSKQQQAHRMQQAALSGRLKQSNEKLRELKDKIQSEDTMPRPEAWAVSFSEEPVCLLIMKRVNEGQFKSKVDYIYYKDYALDKQQLLDLRVAADHHFGQFTTRLKKTYPELTKGDIDYCCLYLLGLSDADIAALMQRAYNTVIERNGKLRRIFGNDNPLFITLKDISNNHSII